MRRKVTFPSILARNDQVVLKQILRNGMARLPTPPTPRFESKQLSLSDIENGIKKLQKRISEVEQLDAQALASNDPIGGKVTRSIRDTVAEIFGEKSREADDFLTPSLYYHPGPIRMGYGGYDNSPYYADGIKKMVVDLRGLIEKLEERREDLPPPNLSPTTPTTQPPATREVFIVHGHDEAAKQEVARFVEQLGLKPVILHEQTNRGSTTIFEKFERQSNAPFAIVLLTPDDVGATSSAPDSRSFRARQNVILELGYFLAKLGRERVCTLYKEGVETPSDFSGVLYILLDSNGGWKLRLAGELQEVWSDIDLNKARR